jgi:peptidylprolyl isomerase
MNMRLIILPVIAVLAALVLVIAACGDDDDDDTESAATSPAAASQTEPAQSADCPAPSGDAPVAQEKTYPSAPEMTIDTSKTYTATVKTVRGDVVIKLRPDLAPQHVNSFVFLAKDGYFDGVTFHRVIPNFVAQTGDPSGTGSGGPGYQIPAEFTNEVQFVRGTVGMARTQDPNSAGSQWFINYAATPNLDGQYTIFGEVTEGMDVVDCITPRDPSANPNLPPGDQIISVEIDES